MGQTPEQYEQFNELAQGYFEDLFGPVEAIDWARIRRQFAEARRAHLLRRDALTDAEGRELEALEAALG